MKSHNKIRTIIWADASSCKDGEMEWYKRDAALKLAKAMYESTAITGGVILEDNKDYIVVASTVSDDLYSDITMIPKRFLIKII